MDPWGLSASDGQKNSPTFGSVVQNFGKGFAEGAWEATQNIGRFIAHPIKTVQATANRITQFGKNLYNDPIGTYNGIKDSIVGAYTMFKNADANEKAWIVGNVTGHVAVDTAAIVATGAASKFAVGKVKSLIRGKPQVSLPQTLSGGKASVLKGQQGERIVRKLYDIGEKRLIKINGRNRIPDGLTKTTLSEVKNVESLSLTRQLLDFADYAVQEKLNFNLYVKEGAHLSEPLLQFMNQPNRSIIYFTP